jgi:serine/threonine-protein kinase
MRPAFDIPPDQWPTLRELLDQGLAVAPPERPAWLARVATTHPALAGRLRVLLEASAGAPMATLPKVETAAFAPIAPAEMPERIGPYRLLRALGEGGMGSVWLAERTDQLQGRRVALKLPHGAWRRAGLAERLRREREILATLHHPNIATLFDAGVADDGQPWLALELVEGEPIDAWCTRLKLDVPARLRLALQVARAVAHAHANLVVHRDLKPSNIFVTADGTVKLLDFGIAKLLDQGVAEETELTRLGGRALTPDYASPEQIRGEPIGTASDVYSLGVVLYELLAGQRPYRLARESRAALEQAVLEADPPRPSDVAGDHAARRALRGDLDTIVLKALKKQPADRYATVDALADDVQRWLEHRPVLAQPDSRAYRMRRFVRRNRVAVGTGSAVMLAVVGGALAALWQARVAVAERERADEVKTFIAELLRDANPAFAGGRKVTVDELLLTTKPKIDQRFADRPAIRAELLTIVGTTLSSIGEDRAAGPYYEDAASAAAAAFGPEHVQTLHSRSMLVKRLGETRPPAEVAAEADRILAAMRRNPDVDPAYLVNLLGQRAHIASDLRRLDEAVAFADEALRVARTRLGEDLEQTLSTAVLLAYSLQRQGDWQRALQAAQEVHRLVFDVRKLPDGHFNAVDARLMLGMALADAGQLGPGLEQLEAGVRHALVKRAPSDSAVGSFRVHLARYQLRAGRVEDALAHLRQALQVHRAAHGPSTRRFATTAAELGAGLLAARQPEQAVEPLREAHVFFTGAPDASTAATTARLAAALALRGDTAQAGPLLATLADADDWEVLYRRGQCARVARQPAQALELQQRALAALKDEPARQVARAEVQIEAGHALAELQRSAEARQAYQAAADTLRRVQLQPSPALAEALAGLDRAGPPPR